MPEAPGEPRARFEATLPVVLREQVTSGYAFFWVSILGAIFVGGNVAGTVTRWWWLTLVGFVAPIVLAGILVVPALRRRAALRVDGVRGFTGHFVGDDTENVDRTETPIAYSTEGVPWKARVRVDPLATMHLEGFEKPIPRAAWRSGALRVTKRGLRVVLRATQPFPDLEFSVADELEGRALLEAIRPDAAPVPELAGYLARGNRALSDWIADLRHPAGYRGAEFPRDELWEIVDDAALPGDVRAAAGVVLGHDGDAASRARLRVAAAGEKDERVRVALDAASDPSREEAIAKALEYVSGPR